MTCGWIDKHEPGSGLLQNANARCRFGLSRNAFATRTISTPLVTKPSRAHLWLRWRHEDTNEYIPAAGCRSLIDRLLSYGARPGPHPPALGFIDPPGPMLGSGKPGPQTIPQMMQPRPNCAA